MEQLRHLMMGLERNWNVASNRWAHRTLALLSWDPAAGLSEVSLLARDGKTSYEEEGQGTVAYLNDPHTPNGAVVLFQEIPENVGLGGQATPWAWDIALTQKTGLTPVQATFDGTSFGQRTSLLDRNFLPPMRMQRWAYFEDEGVYLFTLSNEEGLYFLTVKP